MLLSIMGVGLNGERSEGEGEGSCCSDPGRNT